MTRMTYAMVALCAVATAATAFGTVYNVSATWQLESAQVSLSPGDEIIIQPGTYNLTRSLYITTANVTLRGASGDRDDVIIRGGGMNVDSGSNNIPIQLVADDITIQDLTVADAYYNGIHIHAENYVDRAIIRNVKTLNIGERHIKGSGSGAASWDVLVEHCMFEQTEARLTRPGHSVDPDDYIGGMDCMSAKNWIIRDNVAKGIIGASGTDARGAIFLWQDVVNPLIERNVIIDCARGFSMGNPYNPNNSYLVDGGIIRNNMILRGVSVAMEFDHTRNIKVYNNTVYSDAANYFRTLQIYDVGNPATTGLEFVNNIIRGEILDSATGTWDVATLTAMGNIVDNTGAVVLPTWFTSVTPATANLHLTTQAVPAIGTGTILADAQYDYDDQLRGPVGGPCDMGADQIVQDVPPVVEAVSPNPETVEAGTAYTKQLFLSQGIADSWTLLQGPAEATVTAQGYVTGWTPGATDIGTSVTFEAQATNTLGSNSTSWQVDVVAPPAPVIGEVTPNPDTAKVGYEYTRQLTLTQGQADGWAIVDGPTGLQVDASGNVSGWTPVAIEMGQTVSITIEATNLGGSDTETWDVTVGPGPSAFVEVGGMVVMEAEHAAELTPGSDGVPQSWLEQTGGGASGDAYMRALPTTVPETRVDVDIETTSPQMRYLVQFATTGTYYVWIRGYGEDGTQDSVHYGIDGVSNSSGYADAVKVPNGTTFGWVSADGYGYRLTVEVATAAEHALDIWMRENAAAVDKIILTTDVDYVPMDTGPAESDTIGGAPPVLVSTAPPHDGTLTKVANNVITLTFDAAIELPAGPALHVTPIAGGADLGDSFICSIEPDGLTLKAVEDGTLLTNQTWYRIAPTVALGTQNFAVDVCTLVGDADGNRRVMAADLGVIWSHNGEITDARYDINGDGRVMAVDLGVTWSHNGQIVPAKP